jgi:AcrR family transcriptional regulator
MSESNTPDPTTARWRRLPEQRPRQILDAALAVFGEQGFEQARLEDVAERASVSKGTIYNYFPSKEALFEEMVQQTLSDLLEATATLPASGPAESVLRVFVAGVWHHMRSGAFESIYRLVMAEANRFPHLSRLYTNEVRTQVLGVAASIVERGMSTGEFRRMDGESAARMLVALLVKHGVWCGSRERWPDLAQRTDDEVLEEILEFYVSALRPSAGASVTKQRRR